MDFGIVDYSRVVVGISAGDADEDETHPAPVLQCHLLSRTFRESPRKVEAFSTNRNQEHVGEPNHFMTADLYNAQRNQLLNKGETPQEERREVRSTDP